MKYFGGIDIGSSTAKFTVIDTSGRMVAKAMKRSGVDYGKTAQELLSTVCASAAIDRCAIARIISTGYGRGNVTWSNASMTEIACHGRGAYHHYRAAITVIDIGAQDCKVIHVDASAEFMGALAGVSDPEAKRKIIGREFVEVFQREAKKLSRAKWLAQGTIYPDVIESGGAKTKKATTIKSHHNVGGLPETLGLKLLEPLRDLFKDEVRELGVALGLPHDMVYRHPFPGPGLGVRILGEVKKEYADLLRRADAIFIEELRAFKDEATGKNWYDLTSQAFAVFLPVKSVGVMGDGRTYDYVVALRAVVTSDFMTAHWAELPYTLLGKVSNRIINEVRGINRVVYDICGKPPATIEWE